MAAAADRGVGSAGALGLAGAPGRRPGSRTRAGAPPRTCRARAHPAACPAQGPKCALGLQTSKWLYCPPSIFARVRKAARQCTVARTVQGLHHIIQTLATAIWVLLQAVARCNRVLQSSMPRLVRADQGSALRNNGNLALSARRWAPHPEECTHLDPGLGPRRDLRHSQRRRRRTQRCAPACTGTSTGSSLRRATLVVQHFHSEGKARLVVTCIFIFDRSACPPEAGGGGGGGGGGCSGGVPGSLAALSGGGGGGGSAGGARALGPASAARAADRSASAAPAVCASLRAHSSASSCSRPARGTRLIDARPSP